MGQIYSIKLFRLGLALAVCIVVCAEKALAQGGEPIFVGGGPGSCEVNSASFDYLANVLRSNDERLFVIARLGRGESSRYLNHRRLHNVRTYFKRGWPAEFGRLVSAEGEKADGEGRVEFYVGSKLLLVSLVKRGKDICVDCCDESDPNYYGFGKRDKPKAGSRR